MNISISDQPHAKSVEVTEDALTVHLTDGRSLTVPLEWFPKLRDANARDRQSWRLIGQGVGIHWDKLDEDVSVKGLLIPEQTTLYGSTRH